MAIKRLDPKATFRVVSQNDDSLVHESVEELKGEPSRYEQFLDTLDLSKLKFKEDGSSKPTIFVVRALTNFEVADLNEKYFLFDTTTKKVKNVNQAKMLLEMFNLGCLGIEAENGSIEKVSDQEIGFQTAVEIGAIVNIIGTLGKNLKKQ